MLLSLHLLKFPITHLEWERIWTVWCHFQRKRMSSTISGTFVCEQGNLQILREYLCIWISEQHEWFVIDITQQNFGNLKKNITCGALKIFLQFIYALSLLPTPTQAYSTHFCPYFTIIDYIISIKDFERSTRSTNFTKQPTQEMSRF